MSKSIKKATDLAEHLILPPHHRVTASLFPFRTPSRTFDNPWDTWEERQFSDLVRWNKERSAAGIPSTGWLTTTGVKHTPTPQQWLEAFPPHPVDHAALQSPPSDAIQATWIGHATVLVQLEGISFITDPVFSDRCSPVQWAGPKRVVPVPLSIADIPDTLDFVLISHNHYDHLDTASVEGLYKRFPNLKWYVGLGLKAWFPTKMKRNVVELDWWDEHQHYKDNSNSGSGSSVKVISTPAQHWSLRTPLFQKNGGKKETLWCGFAVIGNETNLSCWFAGDTGYCPAFKLIGERLGPIDLCFIPTGAYEPRWFMKPQHVNPQEAVKIHQEVKALNSISIHAATFPLTDEAMDEPVKFLTREAAAAGLDGDEFVTLKHGGTVRVRQGGGRMSGSVGGVVPVLR
jgi:N-acyl-phosphatidylethanolamine-hydrolysing phospholipase D